MLARFRNAQRDTKRKGKYIASKSKIDVKAENQDQTINDKTTIAQNQQNAVLLEVSIRIKDSFVPFRPRCLLDMHLTGLNSTFPTLSSLFDYLHNSFHHH